MLISQAVLTTAHLKDEQGRAIVGVQFYSVSKKGTTDSQGTFEFVWGEELTFGLDTFEFGRVKGNQLEYRLTDVFAPSAGGVMFVLWVIVFMFLSLLCIVGSFLLLFTIGLSR